MTVLSKQAEILGLGEVDGPDEEWFAILEALMGAGYYVFIFEEYHDGIRYTSDQVKHHNAAGLNWSSARFDKIVKFHAVVMSPAQVVVAQHLEIVSECVRLIVLQSPPLPPAQVA